MPQPKGAASVAKVNTVAEQITRQRVSNVRWDITRMQPGKVHVYHAYPVNSAM
jgi:hypothetical protein